MKPVRITGWSPTKLAAYEECPLRCQLQYAANLCVVCFKGKLMGGFGTPKICDTCGKTIEEKFEHGITVGASLEQYVKGKTKTLTSEIRNKDVRDLAKILRGEHTKAKVHVEYSVVLDKAWKVISQYTKGAWLRVRLDILRFLPGKTVRVIDWKTYGIDRRTGDVRNRNSKKYDDQLEIYGVAALSAFEGMAAAKSSLVFVDTGPRFDPVVERPEADVKRSGLAKAQEKWARRALPMLSDDTFAPRPGPYCQWCEYGKGKGGPCPV